jgi:hypothetical protein
MCADGGVNDLWWDGVTYFWTFVMGVLPVAFQIREGVESPAAMGEDVSYT